MTTRSSRSLRRRGLSEGLHLTVGTSGKNLKQRWDATWRSFGVAPQPPTTLDELIAAYSESSRFYHTLKHLEECFSHFDSAKRLARFPAEIEMAIWFHDAIYNTRRDDNEENSAAWAVNVIRDSGLLSEVAERIGDLILATKHKVEPHGADASLFVDVDLSILGASSDRFDEYQRQIRREYGWVPENEFRQGRAKLLRDISAREHIYFTEFFRMRLEATARENLKQSLLELD
jgi:predicted metal-dependent HD superfamily phosphohydrolase